MRAITAAKKGKTATGKNIVDAFILSDNDPQPIPTTGENVVGMTADDVFAPFSVLFCLAGPKMYIANESGVFTEV